MKHNSTSFRYLIGRILKMYYQPSSVFNWIASEGGRLWLLPLLLVTLITLLRILIGGWLHDHKAMQEGIPLPPDWTYYSPEMQAQYMQAFEATKSPVFVYVLPVIIGFTTIWLGWVIISSLLHLAFTMVGGRGTNASALNLVAWAGVPFALRELLRIIYLLITQHPIVSVGLSGFVPPSESNGMQVASGFFAIFDMFLVWHVILLIIGAKRTETISTAKSIAVILSIIALSIAAQVGTSYLGSQFGGMMVSRPFYF